MVCFCNDARRTETIRCRCHRHTLSSHGIHRLCCYGRRGGRDLLAYILVRKSERLPLSKAVALIHDNPLFRLQLTCPPFIHRSCFGLLFLLMDWAEEILGNIPGFYSVCLVATVYLMLPLFRGSDAVFRNVLVPLAGQRDKLLIRDAHVLHKNMIRQVPAERIESVRAATIAAFTVATPATSKKQE